MIAYFDTSALLDMLLQERRGEGAANLWDRADHIASSRLTYAEGRAALAGVHRAGRLTSPHYRATKLAFDERFVEIVQIEPTELLCYAAGELAERHRLRGYDAVHLASAIAIMAEELILATNDKALARAALAEGVTTAL